MNKLIETGVRVYALFERAVSYLQSPLLLARYASTGAGNLLRVAGASSTIWIMWPNTSPASICPCRQRWRSLSRVWNFSAASFWPLGFYRV